MDKAAGCIVGRDGELAALAAFLQHLEDGPAVFVLQGEAGVGKTILWLAAIEAAQERSFTVLTASPAEAEAEMSFSGLGDLLADVVDEVIPALPEPQVRALDIALLRAEPEGHAPDRRAVAVAFLNVLRRLSKPRSVVVAVDDVQWLDEASASVLAYAARRLVEERVGVLLAERAADAAPFSLGLERALLREQLVSLRVGPLTFGALHRLLHERLGVVFPRPILRRIHDTAAGNPFYALEIARALGRKGLPAPGQPLSVPASLAQLLRGRITAVPPETRRALLVAAGCSTPRLALLTAALDRDSRSALRPAVDADVIELEGDRVRFSHPLFASAAYELAGEAERREAHRRLAAAVDDPEERARHLAIAVEGPDAEVAAALEQAAERTYARGASGAAADLCEQACRLTPPGSDDALQRRLVAAARYAFVAGDAARARELLEQVLAAASAGVLRAEALVLLGRLHRYGGDQPRAAALLRLALAEAGADDHVRADAAQGLASTLYFMREDLRIALREASRAAELAVRARSPTLHAEALATMGLLEGVVGLPEAPTTLRAAEELDESSGVDLVDATGRFAHAYYLIWADGAAEAGRIMRGCYEEALRRGDESSVPLILCSLALVEYLSGRWLEAVRVAEEAHEVALQTGQRPQQAFSLSAHALVRASLGLEAEARADARAALALAGERGMAVARIHALWALGLLELSLDRPGETVRLLAPYRERLLAAGVGEPGSIRFVPDEIEALIALGPHEDAETLRGWLEEHGVALDRASTLAAAGRCRGLLLAARGDGAAALASFERALSEHDRIPIPFDRARTLLALGAVHRRAKRKRAAGEALRDALGMFEQLGATLWAERARNELARLGGRTAQPGELTPTERRLAELVAEGRSNKEAAAALFVTPKTVETKLSRIYAKLDIHSRVELVRHLDELRPRKL